MAAVIGYLLAAGIAIGTALWFVGPLYVVKRDPTFEIGDVSARHVTILGGLAAFAVTGIIFLVTQAQNVPDASGAAFTTVLAMFVVAYMGYFSSSLLFANVSHLAQDTMFDLAAAQYVGASISLFSIYLGWFALVPLFEAFGLTRIADLVSWLLIGALLVGYSQLASALNRSGYASLRLAILLPVFAAVVTLVYAALIGLLGPELRSGEATLALTHVAFVLAVPAYAIHMILPIAADRESLRAVLATRWHLVVVAYAEATMVLMGFVLLSIHGLA
jgi:hypothetical protein